MNDGAHLQTQLLNNRRTADAWERYTWHRQRLADLIAAASIGKPIPTVCILGAGNLNDIDLAQLLQWFHRVVLVDIDREAVVFGVERQSQCACDQIEIVAPWDITGCLFGQHGQQHNEKVCPLSIPGGPFDIVLSAGLLSQLFQSIVTTGAVTHPRLEFLLQVRRQHLQLLLQSIKSDGTAIFVTDVVSSVTVPGLEHVPESSLGNLLEQLLGERNFFIGTHPRTIEREIDQLAVEHQLSIKTTVHPPWLWQIGPDKRHLMWGMTIQK